MKSPTIIDRTYYRCTKRKGYCSQKTVTQENLQQQYLEQLQHIEIPKDFYAFMVRELEALANDETRNELKVIGQLKKQHSELENRLNGLALMCADGDIDKSQYLSAKATTLKSLETLERQIQGYQKSVINWKDSAIDYLNFALHATQVLEKVDGFTKKELLSKLGSNQRLMNRKLNVIRAKPLLAIKDCKLAYEAEKTTLEPDKTIVNKGDLGSFDAANAALCSGLHNVRTSIIHLMKDVQQAA